MDDNGVARTADVIEAADWILAHKDQYNIRVANFSLHSARAGSFKFDPLDHAVERLWFSGVVVVAAAGNFGTGSAVHMDFAPGNDPFVITVGAADINDTLDMGDDTIAPWSAYGPTADGFHKPEVSAPGRYMIGAVPPNATLYGERADHVVENGYMRLSGTSFAAPVVAGAAAALFALHPAWTPNDVKGALMLSAHHLPAVGSFAGGVGEIDLAKAATLNNPPNPNRALSRYVIADAHVLGGYVFDAAGWNDAAKTDASWESASWEDASWESASWESASWESASWESASWESASWEDFSQADSALSDASWEDGGSVD
jgi:serine protease AprX